ncbi:hypothetical protein [Butyrivibrio sp. MB2005]|uniref:hypothetical protein n=1 Tax=Butyrivibrio sp. MB2005 TaxID=1280678 RepID=UPI000422EB37|nr:hypothetical protein [Butyrivibrio sp. MB2005]
MNKERIAIVVEGDVREMGIFDNIKNIFFKSENVDIIPFPAGENIYMLWKQLKEDDFQTDIIEVIREKNKKASKIIGKYTRDDFSEVYLFFDFDCHQDNLGKEQDADVVSEMLETFDNETENGLLYINYPMVEAVRDYLEGECETPTRCFVNAQDIKNYKNLSANNSGHGNTNKYTFSDWAQIIDTYIRRVSCLGEREEIYSYYEYKQAVTPSEIYSYQSMHVNNGKVFVLSAFPEFLLDYNKETFWQATVKHNKNKRTKCGY